MLIELPDNADGLSGAAARHVDVVRKTLVDSWECDEDFLTKFFPITAHTRRTYKGMKGTLRNGERWKGITEKEPKSRSKLFNPLKALMNDALQSFELYEDARRVLNMSRTGIYPDKGYPVRAPLFLVGSGEHFITGGVVRPQPDYAFGISLIEVRLDSEDELGYRDLLATHIQRMFSYQFNRRYAFGMVISQRILTLYMFDRSGVSHSPPLDYHANPEQFFAIISGLASMDGARIGFDTTIWFDGSKGRMLTHKSPSRRKTEEIIYSVYTPLFHHPHFRTRGTFCFLVYEESAPKTLWVTKDSWEPVEELEGRESEASLLKHAHRCGVVKGIVQLRHGERVQIKTHTGRNAVDTVLGNRRIRVSKPGVERIHTRIVMSPYGKPLNHFSNRKELLVAFHDALQGHRALHDVAGILHRDIKPANILITPREEEGNRGMLIDFDHSIRINDTSPYSTKRKIGTYLYMSRNALKGESPQTCVDDLESFFYVLLCITLSFSGPECPLEEVNDLIADWSRPLSFTSKGGFFLEPFSAEVEPYFGKPFENLLKELHGIFHHHRLQRRNADLFKIPEPVLDAARVYDAFFEHIRHAITELDNDPSDSQSSSSSGTTTQIRNARWRQISLDARAEDERYSQVYSWFRVLEPWKEPAITIETTAGANRPRRKVAKYGFTEMQTLRD